MIATTINPWESFVSPITYTNGNAIRDGLIPCETSPTFGGLARTMDAFHAVAAVTTGSQKGNKRHVCLDCATQHHRHQHQVPGVIWD